MLRSQNFPHLNLTITGFSMACINHGFSAILCLCSNILLRSFNYYIYLGSSVSISLLNIKLVSAIFTRYHFLTSLSIKIEAQDIIFIFAA